MRILIVSGGHLPIPAVQGGAVESLIEMYLKENEKRYHNDIDVVSTVLPVSEENKILEYKYSRFIFINNKSKIKKVYYKFINKISNKYIGNYFINKAIKKVKHSKKEYDVVLCENEPAFTILLKKHFRNSKIILHLHNDFLNKDTKRYNEIIESCDRILAVSEFIKTRVNCEDKCSVTYNGIDIQRFNEKINFIDIEELRKKYNISEDDFVFIFVGRIVKEKGIEELVKAFIKLNDKYKHIKLLVVGSPFFAKKKQSKFYNYLRQISNENIIFTGYIPNIKTPNFYNIANVQVTPTLIEEAFGLTALESMVSGKRVIATNSGALPEIVKNENGQIIKREKIEEELYNAMEEEYLNRDLYKQTKKEDFDFTIYSHEEYANRINKSIEELVK